MENDMRGIRHILLLVLVGLALGDVGRAELVPAPAPEPSFSAGDQEIISRNETLRRLKETDPWLVRRVLDELARLRPSAGKPEAPPSPDPDLERLRTSPEGLNDLFQVLKAAGNKKKQN